MAERKRESTEAAEDALFKLPLEQFTAARNALAAKLKKGGKREEAERIKALSKPPLSAWAVNQLYWHQRKAFDQLLTTGEQFRQAQAAQLHGKTSDLRGTLEARREALAMLSRLASALLEDASHPAGPDVMRRVTTTLEALASYGASPEGPTGGRLTADVDAPGFEALAALVPQTGRGSRPGGEPRVLTFPKPKAKTSNRKMSAEEKQRVLDQEQRAHRAAAKVAIHEAEKTLREARKAAERAEAALKKAAASAKETEKAKAELETRYEKVTAAADAARQDARRLATEAEDAAQAVDDAERALDKARQALD